jgi:hypothetical protein
MELAAIGNNVFVLKSKSVCTDATTTDTTKSVRLLFSQLREEEKW